MKRNCLLCALRSGCKGYDEAKREGYEKGRRVAEKLGEPRRHIMKWIWLMCKAKAKKCSRFVPSPKYVEKMRSKMRS